MSPGATATLPTATPPTTTASEGDQPDGDEDRGARGGGRPPNADPGEREAPAVGRHAVTTRYGLGLGVGGSCDGRVDREGQRPEPLDESRPGPGHDHVVDGTDRVRP